MSNLDQGGFGDLIEPHRRELQAHCYRMLGEIQDAEDAVQETFLKAWLRRESYAERATLRAWLYKIATNTCLDHLRKRRRRYIPLTHEAPSSAEDPIPASIHEPIWLEPYPDAYLDPAANPEMLQASREAIRMAFIALLHRLPPRQRAVVLLQDVEGWKAKDIADALEMTVLAVKSALHRARVTLNSGTRLPVETALTMSQQQLDRYVEAWERGDTEGLISLMTEDATFSMPPIPSWYQGKENIRMLVAKTVFAGNASTRWRLLPIAANRQQAFALYRQNQAERYENYGIQLIEMDGRRIGGIITFRDTSLFPRFGLPATL